MNKKEISDAQNKHMKDLHPEFAMEMNEGSFDKLVAFEIKKQEAEQLGREISDAITDRGPAAYNVWQTIGDIGKREGLTPGQVIIKALKRSILVGDHVERWYGRVAAMSQKWPDNQLDGLLELMEPFRYKRQKEQEASGEYCIDKTG